MKKWTNSLLKTLKAAMLTILLCGTSIAQADEQIPTKNQAAFTNVLNKHVATLSNLNVANSPMFVMFSSAPGMGEDILAKQLESYMQGIRVNTMEIRKLFLTEGINADAMVPGAQMSYLQGYLIQLTFYLDQSSPNKLIIVDACMDGSYEKVASFASLKKIPTFLIRMEVTKDVALERLAAHPDVANLQNYFDTYYDSYTYFNKLHVNYFFNNMDNQATGDISGLVAAINSKF